MINRIINKNLISFYIAFALLTIAFSLPHAVLTIVLLNKGLTLSQIMLTQAVYSFAVLISEYPSGLFADMYSKKNIFIISKIFIVSMFILVIFTRSFIMMAIAWFLYGISSALDSGTIDVELINDLKSVHRNINGFIKNSNRLNFISLLIGSSIGSFSYYIFGIKFYWISVVLTILSTSIIVFCYKENKVKHHNVHNISFKSMINESKIGITEVKKKTPLKLMIFLTFVGQFFFQAHFQMWQAVFLSKDFDKHNFYLIYIIFQVISILAYSIHLPKVSKLRKINLYKINLGFILALIFFLIAIKMVNGIPFALFYTLLVFIFTVFDYLSNYLFSKYVSKNRISSLTSLKSSCGRIASLMAMLDCGVLLNFTSVINTVIINFGISSIMSILIVISYIKIANKNFE